MKHEIRTALRSFAIVAIGVASTRHVVSAPIEIAAVQRAEAVEFAKEIYPLLKRNCLACHNTTKAKGGLNLESPQLMAKGGDSGPALIAGKSMESLLLKAAAHLDDDMAMPPPGNKSNAVSLTPGELGLLKLWIDQGAKGDSVADSKGPLPWRPVAGGPVNAVAFSPDSRLVAAARGNRVELCELATGRVLTPLGDPELAKLDPWRGQQVADRDAVMSAAFGADDLLATGGFREVRLWRRQPRAVKKELGKLAEMPTALAVSADGKWAAAGDAKGAVWLWANDAEKFEPVQLKDHATAVTALTFSPDNALLISTAEDKGARVWRVADRTISFKCETPAVVRSLAFAGSELIGGCADGIARVWTWPVELPVLVPKPVREFKLQEQPLGALAVLPGEKNLSLVWAGADGAIHVTNAVDGKEQRKFTPEHPSSRRLAAIERELAVSQGLGTTRKSQLTASADKAKKEAENAKKTAQEFEKARTELRNKAAESDAAAEVAALSPKDKGLQDTAKKAADAATKAEKAFRAAKANAELGSRMASDAAGVLAGAEAALANAEAAVTEYTTAIEAAKKLVAEPQPLAARLSISHDGASVMLYSARGGEPAGAAAGWLRHVTLDGGVLLEPLDKVGHGVVVPSGQTGEGSLLSVGADGVVLITSPRRVWSLERVIGNAEDPALFADRVTALAFSPDGKVLATGGGVPSREGELKLWRIADGTLLQQIEKAHTDTVNSVAFSSSGDFLASASSDRLVRIWKTADGSRVANFEGHTGHVLGVAWRADGLALATGGADRSLRTWDFPARKAAKKSDISGEVSALVYAGAGDVIFSATGTQARLGDQGLPESPGFLFCAAADNAGKLVAAGGMDGVLRVWTAGDRKVMRSFGTPRP